MSQQLQITGGAKVRDLQDVIIGTSGVLSSLAFNVANGVPKLDVNGKILVSQLPNSVMEYQGTWNAATNTPTLVNGTGNQGDVYLCNVAGTTNFGAGPITFAVGDSAIYSGTIWQRAGGATGTVTSVGLSTSGNAFTIGSSPVTTSGTITINGSGNSGQYINGAGNLTTFPTLISSIGLTMPSAFSVANSPLTSNGTIAVTGAGYPSQYIRGDGTLADFPTSGGGGSSVSYYLNGGTSQGTIGGVTYYEMSKTADTGTGVDFTKSGDGFIVAFLTDAGDPAQLNIPAGNWNYEIYASMSANGGTPQMYAELYVYDGTTFTLISTSTNEILYDGTNLNLYSFGMTVPATTLALTDRLAIKLYATNSGGKTTTVHTQDSHLCQIITTFSTGITALNGLTAQVQYFATGTSGTDFNISSTTATHTFNIPSASATNRGLITTGSQTIAGDKAFTGINSFDYGINYKTGASLANVSGYISQAYATSGTGAGSTLSLKISDGNSVKAINLDFVGSPATYTYTFPAASGTIALTSSLSSYVPYTGATTNVDLGGYALTANNIISNSTIFLNGIGGAASSLAIKTYIGAYSYGGSGYVSLSSTATNGLSIIYDGALSYVGIISGNILTGTRTYTLPDASGTIALTSNLSSYVPYSGATGAVNLGAFDLTVNSVKIGEGGGSISGNTILGAGSLNANTTGYQNTAIGYATLNLNTTGYDNTSVGYAALNLNTTGFNNTAIGSRSLFNNTTGNSNTSVGYISLTTNTTGVANTSIGYASLANNTTGFSNVAVGYNSMANSNGNENTAIGNQSMQLNTTGVSNTAIGHTALQSNTTGNNNIAIGYESGINITTGSNNTIIGKYAGTSALANNIVLADGAGNIKYRWDGTNNNLYGNVNFSSTIGNGTYTYTLPSATGTLALTSDISGYLPLTGGTLTGQLYINPTNTATVGLDVASNTTRFRSDNLEGFKRQLQITMGSGTLVQFAASGFGANYNTDLAFYTSSTSGINASPAIYITGTSNRVGIKTGLPDYDLDVTGTINSTKTITSRGQTDPTSGVGMELFYRTADTSSYIQSYDRTSNAWKNVRIYGNALYFGSQGNNNLNINSSGIVLINTISSNASMGQTGALQVEGGIRATTGLLTVFEVGTIAQNATSTQSITNSGFYLITNGGNASALFMITRAGGSRGCQLIFSTNSNLDIVCGTTTEPIGGNYLRLWMSAVGVLSIKNVSAYTGPYSMTPISTQ